MKLEPAFTGKQKTLGDILVDETDHKHLDPGIYSINQSDYKKEILEGEKIYP